MAQKSRQEAGEMAFWLMKTYSLTFMAESRNVSRMDVWADVLLDYEATGVMPAHCDTDDAAAEAWDWVMGEESPLDGYAAAYTGPEQTGGQP